MGGKRKQLRIELAKTKRSNWLDEKMHRMKRAENRWSENQLHDPKESLKGKRSKSKHLHQDSSPERWRGWGVKRILLSDIYNPKTQNSFLLDSTTAKLHDQSRELLRWVEALIPTCHAQYAILSQSRYELMIGAQPHFERIARWISYNIPCTK